MRDKNGTILKIGDKVRAEKGIKGIIWELANICGVTLFVIRDKNREIKCTMTCRKMERNKIEKV